MMNKKHASWKSLNPKSPPKATLLCTTAHHAANFTTKRPLCTNLPTNYAKRSIFKKNGLKQKFQRPPKKNDCMKKGQGVRLKKCGAKSSSNSAPSSFLAN